LQNVKVYADFRDLPPMREGDWALVDPPYVGYDCFDAYGMSRSTNLLALNRSAFDQVNRSEGEYLLTTGCNLDLERYFVAHGARCEHRPWRNGATQQLGCEMYVTRARER
jgi:hypothetical protein